MATLNLEFGYFRNPKTKRLIGILGKSYADIPLRLWCHTGEFFVMDGILKGYTVQAVEDAVEYQGEPGKCVAALIEAGFLETAPNGYYVSGWNEEQKHLAAFKLKSIKMNSARLKKISEENVDNLLNTVISDSDQASTSSTSSSSSRDFSDSLQAVPMQGKTPQVNAFHNLAEQSNNNALSSQNNESKDQSDYIYQLSDVDFIKWCSYIQDKIDQENTRRPNNPFNWISREGKLQTDEWKSLFHIYDNKNKQKLLLEAYNVLRGKLYWNKYVELSILIVVRISNKKVVDNPMGLTRHFISNPAELVNECYYGVLKEYFAKVISR